MITGKSLMLEDTSMKQCHSAGIHFLFDPNESVGKNFCKKIIAKTLS